MTFKSSLIASILLATLSQHAIAEDNPTVAVVNGQDVKNSMLQFYALERRQVNDKKVVPMERLVDDLVNMQLLKEEALKKGLENDEGFKTRMQFLELSMLSQVAMINFLDNNPIAEEILKKEYNSRLTDMKSIELKASHILMEDEATAKEVISKLNKGEDFAALAKKYSVGPSASKGGNLGWFAQDRMVAEFSKAVLALKDNEYTKQPVRTQFGLHVILRTGQRDGKPPTFEQVKPAIVAALEQGSIESHIEALRKTANIKVTLKK